MKIQMNHREEAYIRAKQRVDQVRNFYVHAIIYIVVNIGISILKVSRNLSNGETLNEALFDMSTFFTWIVWGIGLGLHAFSVFGLPLILGKNWEQERIAKFMKEEEENKSQN